MTNYEKLRSLGIEEMEEMFCKDTVCGECTGNDSCVIKCNKYYNGFVKWLESEAELKPCPFCGSKVETMQDVTGTMMFTCPKCGAYVYFYRAERGAKEIESWNRRVENADG